MRVIREKVCRIIRKMPNAFLADFSWCSEKDKFEETQMPKSFLASILMMFSGPFSPCITKAFAESPPNDTWTHFSSFRGRCQSNDHCLAESTSIWRALALELQDFKSTISHLFMRILALASILLRAENIKSIATSFFHLCLSGERQPLADKNKSDPRNLGNSLYPVYQSVLWTFSIYLESVAILPQLFMISSTGQAETITAHYLFALGSYRAMYLLNWIYRYYTEDVYDLIAIVAGCVQTLLYIDFFYLYVTKVLKGKSLVLPV
ncbi:hypothetical protein T265_09958 [Opisthorchis viverrini]|uniref:ER lumen protein-retaining receptor n=1 Tax=Opisthorchis viverrini TaxID=6198 RepID=A0A074Z422_OPIVI|nr:hypothetical protein T265_09958 [Opisthorchis viverrini]KER21798.1 hypothetical protein T265_09958 [Opisthorchis viverrini]